MKIFRFLFYILAAWSAFVGLVYVTIAFSGEKNIENKDDKALHSVQTFWVNFSDSGEFTKTSIADFLDENSVFYADFWRLSSAFLMNDEAKNSIDLQKDLLQETVKKDGSDMTRIVVGKVKGIFSWYDPFGKYSIEDSEGTFDVEQITNGSIYFGREADGTISLYSIDLVAELSFHSDWEKMTSMIVFPGMYVRFDPKKNNQLKWADLLKIMLSLKQADDNVNTGIEFVNARIKTNLQDVFFMYRLPQKTKILFQHLRDLFRDRINTVNKITAYSQLGNTGFVGYSNENRIQNPTKNGYRLLWELQVIFSKWVKWEITPADFRREIVDIIEKSKEFGIDNQARGLVAQFLVDGRFALFMTNAENVAQYQALYNEAASILEITPTTWKWQLFQVLSDIFSKNLIDDIWNFSDNYNNVSLALKNTLSQWEIETKDYFDISLYSFLIFQKISEGNSLSRVTIENPAIYQLYTTIINASQKYVKTLPDAMTAQKSLVSYFYEEMFRLLSKSLYEEFSETIDGSIFVRKGFIEKGLPALTALPINDLKEVYNNMNTIYTNNIQKAYSQNERISRNNFEAHLARIDGFLSMIAREKYYLYQKNPYLAEKNSSLPQYDALSRTLVIKENEEEQAIVKDNSEITQNSEENQKIADALTSIFKLKTPVQTEDIKKLQTGYQVTMEYQGRKVRFLYTPEKMTFSAAQVASKKFNIIRIVDSFSAVNFQAMLVSFSAYEQKIQKILSENPKIEAKNIILHLEKNQIQIQSKNFPLN